MEGVDTELGEVALVYLKMYDLVRLGAKAGRFCNLFLLSNLVHCLLYF